MKKKEAADEKRFQKKRAVSTGEPVGVVWQAAAPTKKGGGQPLLESKGRRTVFSSDILRA
ncbi:hypothetical protein ATPR_1567 [Acetobacter tropicalis NBRC 101654]|uniref:Uncharacterized protein n=1 Tax=Acetobacter tropicalis NBRC 101654 TaxID=749388 RepID=F7VDW8_9PROT|nr:hypothetical protein ATPR_1567 [Acetobacter tropicalis NBRC 101654]